MGNRMSNIAAPMPQLRAKFTSKLGIPLSGCKVYTYEPSSDILKKTWLDIDKTVENTNPILLDAAGEADIYLDGLYRIVVKDRFGFVVYDVEKTGYEQPVFNDSLLLTWSGRTQEEKNKEDVSIYDFVQEGDLDFSAALQRAVSQPRRIYFPSGDYNFSTQVDISVDNIMLYGEGRLLWANATAGSTCIGVVANNFKVIGLQHECVGARRTFYRVGADDRWCENLYFKDCVFRKGFYAVRGGYANDNGYGVRNVFVVNCDSVAPDGVNAGHYIMTHGDGVYYIGNRNRGGMNTATYGLIHSKNFVIIGNIEDGVQPSGAGAEASIQIEDSNYAHGVIANNVCSHDIWISGSNHVSVYNNRCGALRVSVGNPKGYDVHHAVFENNYCSNISLAILGSNVNVNKYAARFVRNTIDPQYKVDILGRSLPNRSISVSGAYARKVVFIENTVISQSQAEGVSVVRGADLDIDFINNTFFTPSNIVTGAGGNFLQIGNNHPIATIFPFNPTATVGCSFSSEQTIPTSNSWVTVVGANNVYDLNNTARYNATTGEFDLPVGNYEVVCRLGLRLSTHTENTTLGIRLIDEDGGEITRLYYGTVTPDFLLYCGSAMIRGNATRGKLRIQVYCTHSLTLSDLVQLSNISFSAT